MSDIPQAFPHGNPTDGGDIGMTLRDWFAGQALAGMLTHASAAAVDGPTAEVAAGAAFQFADAMLRERKS